VLAQRVPAASALVGAVPVWAVDFCQIRCRRGDILKRNDVAGAKKLLAERSYKGEPVTCIVAQDQPITKARAT